MLCVSADMIRQLCVRENKFERDMAKIPSVLLQYHESGKPLVTRIPVQPWVCELWPLDQVRAYNSGGMILECAPGYFGFGSNGAGELFAFSPSETIVCLDFCGLNPQEALHVASSWSEFTTM